jgi:hypothetical protein
MAEHEPLDIATKDTERKERADTPTREARGTAGSADAQVASEPMDLQRLPETKAPPPGRQRTGDPPAKSRQ